MKPIQEVKIAVIGLGYVGLPLAVEFSKKYPVVGFDINQGEMASVATFIKCDIGDAASVESAFAEFKKTSSKLDILINNAGIGSLTTVEKETDEIWHKVLNINVVGTARVSRAAIALLRESKSAAIVNTASVAAIDGIPNRAAYSASKGAIIAMTYGIARQLAPKKITVNCVAPGTIESDMLKERDEETIKRLLSRFPIGRFGTSDEVAAAVCYFASEEAGFTTGAVLDVNGGLFMG